MGGDRGSRPSASHTLHSQLPCFFLSSSPKPLFDCKILILHKFLLISPTSHLFQTPPPPLYFTSPTPCTLLPSIHLALVVKRLDSAIHWINCYPVDECKAIQLPYLVDCVIDLLIKIHLFRSDLIWACTFCMRIASYFFISLFYVIFRQQI